MHDDGTTLASSEAPPISYGQTTYSTSCHASFEPHTKGYTKKKEEVLPIFKKRNHWCFRHNGVLHKLDSESEAKEMYKALN